MKLALKFDLGEIPEDLSFPGSGLSFKLAGKTPADVVNEILPYVFVIAGLILLAMLVGGGFTIFVSAGNPEKIKQGTGMITSALIGFLIMFAAYWILELVQYTLGLSIL
jgi:hypothetical protein